MHQPFYSALLSPQAPAPQGLTVWNGSDPAVRFAVYRNNVMVSLIDALADNCPVLQAQVGEDFFRAMAAEFIRQHPPSSPVLAQYGEGFADWIAAFPPLADWPWLADLAKLEFAFITALHAPDTQTACRIFPSAVDPQTTGLVMNNSLQVVCSRWAIYQIWCAHQTEDPVSDIDPSQPESVLLFRHNDDVMILPVSAAQAQFTACLAAGATLFQALEEGKRDEPDFSPEKTLAQLHHYGLLVALREDLC